MTLIPKYFPSDNVKRYTEKSGAEKNLKKKKKKGKKG